MGLSGGIRRGGGGLYQRGCSSAVRARGQAAPWRRRAVTALRSGRFQSDPCPSVTLAANSPVHWHQQCRVNQKQGEAAASAKSWGWHQCKLGDCRQPVHCCNTVQCRAAQCQHLALNFKLKDTATRLWGTFLLTWERKEQENSEARKSSPHTYCQNHKSCLDWLQCAQQLTCHDS